MKIKREGKTGSEIKEGRKEEKERTKERQEERNKERD
jgi:hypothetical protein